MTACVGVNGMRSGGQARTRGAWVVLRDALVGRPTATGAAAVITQLVLIVAWHAAVLHAPLRWADELGERMQEYCEAVDLYAAHSLYDPISSGAFEAVEDECALHPWLPLVVTCEGALAYVVYRALLRRRARDARLFVRAWWRACLWGVCWIPLLVATCALAPYEVTVECAAAAVAIYLLLAPALLARGEARPRRPRWQPVCPECGYSLRRLAGAICPECGEALPTPVRAFRRWANHRLVWDRRRRGALPFDYLRTGLNILLRPWRAARGLTLPDRLPRAVRWASGHILLISAASALLVGSAGLSGHLEYYLRERPSGESELAPPTVWVGWAVQSVLAWAVSFGLLPVLGILLGALVPGRHPVAKRTIAKWSLYVVPVAAVPWAIFVGLAIAAAYPPPGISWRLTIALGTLNLRVPTAGPLAAVALVYALWWAAGVAANPYLRVRGARTLALHACLFMATWLLVTEVLFPCGALELLR